MAGGTRDCYIRDCDGHLKPDQLEPVLPNTCRTILGTRSSTLSGIRQLVWKLALKLWLASRKSHSPVRHEQKSAVAPAHPQKTSQAVAPYGANRNHEMKFDES